MIRQCKLSISDPWEIGEKLGWPVFVGDLHLHDDFSCGVFHFQNVVCYNNIKYLGAVLQGRHGTLTSAVLEEHRGISCSAICVPFDEIADPIGFAQKWRGGGLTFIGLILS